MAYGWVIFRHLYILSILSKKYIFIKIGTLSIQCLKILNTCLKKTIECMVTTTVLHEQKT